MRRYETMVILEPDLPEDRRKPVLERVEDTIGRDEGFLIEFDDWGNRKMAYEIKRKTRGHYIRVDFCGTGDTVREMERFFRIDDRVMRYLTVLLEEEPDLDAIKAAMEAESEGAEQETAEAEAPEAKDETAPEEANTETETEE
ncbi:MAG: 30S ribosomal protein S6 [Desulfococcaceae bacterium]